MTHRQSRNPESDFFLNQAIRGAIEASREILKHRLAGVKADFKKDKSPVTDADRAAHIAICDSLNETGLPILSEEGDVMPYEIRKKWTRLWIVDPLDGTKEFIKGLDEFTVNVALVENGRPVMGVIVIPMRSEIYFGGMITGKVWRALIEDGRMIGQKELTGQRSNDILTLAVSRSHLDEKTLAYVRELEKTQGSVTLIRCGSSLKFCQLAAGVADVYPRFNPCMEWDTAAGHALIRGVGFELIDLKSGEEMLYNRPDLINGAFIAGRIDSHNSDFHPLAFPPETGTEDDD
jgi:3'(2'), 5'-bisphosphate nucleotidase